MAVRIKSRNTSTELVDAYYRQLLVSIPAIPTQPNINAAFDRAVGHDLITACTGIRRYFGLSIVEFGPFLKNWACN